MSIGDAIERSVASALNPLRTDAITMRLMAEGLWQSAGKPPMAPISARLDTDIKQMGVALRMVNDDSQRFALRKTPFWPPLALRKAVAAALGKSGHSSAGCAQIVCAGASIPNSLCLTPPKGYVASQLIVRTVADDGFG